MLMTPPIAVTSSRLLQLQVCALQDGVVVIVTVWIFEHKYKSYF